MEIKIGKPEDQPDLYVWLAESMGGRIELRGSPSTPGDGFVLLAYFAEDEFHVLSGTCARRGVTVVA